MTQAIRKKILAMLLGVLSSFSLGNAAINYLNFNDTAGLTFVGNTYADSGAILLTDTNTNYQKGACWYNTKIDVKKGFETTYQFKMQVAYGFLGADGMAFVIQTDPDSTQALGTQGEGMGFYHIQNGIAVEFDTYCNIGWEDGNENHIAIQSSTQEYPEIMPSHVVSSLAIDSLLPDLKNGEIYTVKIRYDGTNLTVGLNNAQILTAVVNWDTILDPTAAGKAWVGFTAGTGVYTENHKILNWTLSDKIGPKIVFPSVNNNQNSNLQNLKVSVFDFTGKKVATLFNNYFQSGQDKNMRYSRQFSSGAYFYCLQGKNINSVKKIMRVK